MTITLKANSDGTSGALQVNGVDAVPFDGNGFTGVSVASTVEAQAGTNNQKIITPLRLKEAQIQAAASVTCAGQTVIDFGGIPAWAKRITVMFGGVNTNGTSSLRIRIGDAGGLETTGYLGYSASLGGTALANAANPTAGFDLSAAATAAVRHGKFELVKLNGDTWVCNGFFGRSDGTSAEIFAGSKTLSDVLTQVSITTVGGTNTFVAGTINILFE
jgi:hypothetical protein